MLGLAVGAGALHGVATGFRAFLALLALYVVLGSLPSRIVVDRSGVERRWFGVRSRVDVGALRAYRRFDDALGTSSVSGVAIDDARGRVRRWRIGLGPQARRAAAPVLERLRALLDAGESPP